MSKINIHIKYLFAIVIILSLCLFGVVKSAVLLLCPAYLNSTNVPAFNGTLRISVFNVRNENIEVYVMVDGGAVLFADLSARTFVERLFSSSERGVTAAFSPSLGKHEVSVVLRGEGELARREYIQEAGQTNSIIIYITEPTNVRHSDCRILLSEEPAAAL